MGVAQAQADQTDVNGAVYAPVVEDVRFDNEGVTLAGWLRLPAGRGPHPAMVYVHGSGRRSRHRARDMADYFDDLVNDYGNDFTYHVWEGADH